MTTKFLAILFFATSAFAQTAIQVNSPDSAKVWDQGLKIEFSYTLPENDLTKAAKSDPWMAAKTVTWLWNDQESGKPVSHDIAAYDASKNVQTASHVFKKQGTYTIVVLVNDGKNRNIVQTSMTVKLNPLVEVQKP